METQHSLSITLTKDEALVLSAMLIDLRDQPALPIRDQAERRVLWNLTCILEKSVAEVLSPTYGQLVEVAKKNLSR